MALCQLAGDHPIQGVTADPSAASFMECIRRHGGYTGLPAKNEGLDGIRRVSELLRSGKLLAAGMDVVSAEPIRADNPLLTAPNCFLTPHIAWAPLETRRRLQAISAENLRAFLAGKPQNVVNP